MIKCFFFGNPKPRQVVQFEGYTKFMSSVLSGPDSWVIMHAAYKNGCKQGDSSWMELHPVLERLQLGVHICAKSLITIAIWGWNTSKH